MIVAPRVKEEARLIMRLAFTVSSPGIIVVGALFLAGVLGR